MAYFKWIFTIFIMAGSVSASDRVDNIYLKNGTIYTSSILCVNEWGLTFENSKSCSFRSIDKIETYKSDVVNEIRKLYPAVQISYFDSLFILNMESLTIIPRKHPDGRLSKRFAFQMLSKYNTISYPEIRLSFEPGILSNFICELTYFLNIADPSDSDTHLPKFLAFSAGAGVNINKSGFGVSLLLKNLPGGNRMDEHFYLSSNLRANIIKQLFVIISYDYFFRNIKINREIKRYTLNIGFGINL